MTSINYFSGVVKILENPIKTISKENISTTKLRVEIPQVRKNKLLHLIFRGKLADNVQNYYQVNDYILIEGYLIIKENLMNATSIKRLKKVEVSVLKIYPLYLNSKQLKNKIEK